MQSLRKRPTYNEVIDYLENDQTKIKYPDRRATFLRNSPYLSQFDGDSWIDLEEQENNINKEKLKEMEVKKLAAETQTTAQVIRATNKHISIQTGGLRNTESSNVGSQTERPPTLDVGTQRNVKGVGTQYESPQTQIFDISMDTPMDETMYDLEIAAASQAEEVGLRHEKIKKLVERNLGDVEPKDVAHQMANAVSSSAGPMVEEKMIKPGRPLITYKSQARDMVVNNEGEQQKRSAPASSEEQKERKGRAVSLQPQPMQIELPPKRRGRTRSPPKSKSKAKAEPKPIVPAIEAPSQPEPKPEPKPIPTHGVEKIENIDRKFWGKQNMTVIKQQSELRGYRFSDDETKGGTKMVKGKMQKVKKFSKNDYLNTLYKLLKI